MVYLSSLHSKRDEMADMRGKVCLVTGIFAILSTATPSPSLPCTSVTEVVRYALLILLCLLVTATTLTSSSSLSSSSFFHTEPY